MSQPPTTVARVIRAALIILPFGTIVLGALSFVFYFNKQDKVMQRSIKYAAGLRKDLNDTDLKRYEQNVTDTLAQPTSERAKTLATYIESTLGPENMGYEVRAIRDTAAPQEAPLALDVEITGSKRANDVVLVLADYLGSQNSRAVAAMLGAAHSMTGTPRLRTVRFVALQNLGALKAYQQQAVSQYDRITHILLLGDFAAAPDAEVSTPLYLQGRGTVILRPDLKGNVLPVAQSVLKQVTDLADRL